MVILLIALGAILGIGSTGVFFFAREYFNPDNWGYLGVEIARALPSFGQRILFWFYDYGLWLTAAGAIMLITGIILLINRKSATQK